MTKSFISFMCSAALLHGDLTKEEAKAFSEETYRDLAAKRSLKMKELREGFQLFEIKAAGKTMKCAGKLYGEAEEGERRLFISMHGGGGAPERVNTRQWNNQIKLYVPKEGWYVAPRAPTDTWNLWHEGHIDALFSRLIEDMVANHGVDPNKVYLMGYSAGGDGVYQLAPRLADRFGAASMMAGHPNDATADGLYNLPFLIYMGGKDAAYKRNEVAAEWGKKLEALQKKHGGYDHKVTIYPELGHWMEKKDAEAVPWMAGKSRNPWPKKVIWGKSGKRSERFYWLGGSPEGVVEAEVKGQEISIKGAGKDEITLYLSDALIDLDESIKVMIDGRVVFEEKAPRTKNAIKTSLEQRLDPSMSASVIVKIRP
jgi:poly(3-hydroxybutyrate) depolymerase